MGKLKPKPEQHLPRSTNHVPSAAFGPPPLLEGEDRNRYDNLLVAISRDLGPTDTLEEIWVRDVADLTWEVLRLRRLKAAMLNARLTTAISNALSELVDEEDPGEAMLVAQDLAEGWHRCDPENVAEVKRLLASANITMDELMAETLTDSLDHVERIDRLMASAEARRDDALRQIEWHRSSLAAALRRNVARVEDVEYHVVDDKPDDRCDTP
jgi:hypothetical protein